MKHTMLFRSLGFFIVFFINSSKLLIWVFLIIILFALVDFRSSPVEFRCSHLNFRYHATFEQEVPRHSRNYGVWIHSKTHKWHHKACSHILVPFEWSARPKKFFQQSFRVCFLQKILNEIVYTYLKLNNFLKRHKYPSWNVSNIKYIPILISQQSLTSE